MPPIPEPHDPAAPHPRTGNARQASPRLAALRPLPHDEWGLRTRGRSPRCLPPPPFRAHQAHLTHAYPLLRAPPKSQPTRQTLYKAPPASPAPIRSSATLPPGLSHTTLVPTRLSRAQNQSINNQQSSDATHQAPPTRLPLDAIMRPSHPTCYSPSHQTHQALPRLPALVCPSNPETITRGKACSLPAPPAAWRPCEPVPTGA